MVKHIRNTYGHCWSAMGWGSLVILTVYFVSQTASVDAHPDATPSDGQTAKKEALPRAIVSTHELMELFNRPVYRFMKEEMQKTRDELNWDTISERGLQTAEVANLVALRNGGNRWHELSAKLQQAGEQLAETAKSRNYE